MVLYGNCALRPRAQFEILIKFKFIFMGKKVKCYGPLFFREGEGEGTRFKDRNIKR